MKMKKSKQMGMYKMSQKEIDYADIKYLIENYRQACESEEFDEFLNIFGDYDELVEELVAFIEKYVIKNK